MTYTFLLFLLIRFFFSPQALNETISGVWNQPQNSETVDVTT